MSVALPVVVQSLLEDYLEGLGKALPGLVIGFYLHGSVVLGAFDPRVSAVEARRFIRFIIDDCNTQFGS